MNESRVREIIGAQLAEALRQGVFPGAAVALALRTSSGWQICEVQAGKLSPELGAVHSRTFYDIASLTKPITAMATLFLAERGVLKLSDTVGHWLPFFGNRAIGQVTLQELLSHRAGFAAWHPFYEDIEIALPVSRRWRILNELILDHWSTEQRGRALYSDLDYLLLTQVLERAASQSLSQVLRDSVFVPLGLNDITYQGSARSSAPTGFSAWRGRSLCGEVNDDNCACLGGISAHAGLFATASDMARFAMAVLDAHAGRSTWLSSNVLNDALKPQDQDTFRVGWDGMSKKASAFGSKADPNAFGHLGFTGTSIYCDPQRELVIVLLSNRVHPDATNLAISAFRPRFHDAVLGAAL